MRIRVTDYLSEPRTVDSEPIQTEKKIWVSNAPTLGIVDSRQLALSSTVDCHCRPSTSLRAVLLARLFQIVRELRDALCERNALDSLDTLDLTEPREQEADGEPRLLAEAEEIALLHLRVGRPSAGRLLITIVLLAKRDGERSETLALCG